jgi:hypothetical protein
MLCARANSLIEVAHLSSLQVKSESTPDGSGRLLAIPKCPPLGFQSTADVIHLTCEFNIIFSNPHRCERRK